MIKRTLDVTSPSTSFQAVSAILLAAIFALTESSSIDDERVPATLVIADSSRHQTGLKLDEGTSLDLMPSPPDEKDFVLALDIAANIEPSAPDMDASAMGPRVPDIDQVREYLWSVYQRSSAKLDSHGDFTWKDAAAAARLGLSIEEYVIGGIDPDFREQLFAAGQALDAAGIDWTILSAFRDDYRQSLAVGFKAQAGNSFHGGSAATGGYGHGCAIDLASTDGLSNYMVWNWLDQYGELFGLHRPLSRIDPAHVQPSARWHGLASRLRNERVGVHPDLSSRNPIGSDLGEPIVASFAEHFSDAGLSEEQFNCVHPPPAEESHAGGILTHLKAVITPPPGSGAERIRSKATRRTFGVTGHRVTRRSPSEHLGSHAKLKGGPHLAG
jgi:hypothetical protein